jgi:hypothetical protein
VAKKAEIDSDKDKVTVKAQKTQAGLKKEKKAPTKKTTAETVPAPEEQLSVPVKKTAAKKKTDKKTKTDTKTKRMRKRNPYQRRAKRAEAQGAVVRRFPKARF